MKFAYSGNPVAADFYINGYRISCQVPTPAGGGLHALLMDPLNSYLEVEDAYISRISNPGEIVAHYDLAAMRKENILFIILTRREDGSLPRSAGSYLESSERAVFLTVPSFEIRGMIETDVKTAPRDILLQIAGRFVPVFEGSAALAEAPDTSFGGKLLLVNKERIESFCVTEI
jgi:hypothetical protein